MLKPPVQRNRKIEEEELVRLALLGYSLATIASRHNSHPSSFRERLDRLAIPRFDARRTFLEDLYATLPKQVVDTLGHKLYEGYPATHTDICTYLRTLIIQDVLKTQLEPQKMEPVHA